MLQNILATSKYFESALYAVLGFLIVFIGIAFLIFVVWLAGKVFSKINSGKKSTPKVISSPRQEELPVVEEAEEVSEETVAVIMAALMAYYQVERPKYEFTVRRIKRI